MPWQGAECRGRGLYLWAGLSVVGGALTRFCRTLSVKLNFREPGGFIPSSYSRFRMVKLMVNGTKRGAAAVGGMEDRQTLSLFLPCEPEPGSHHLEHLPPGWTVSPSEGELVCQPYPGSIVEKYETLFSTGKHIAKVKPKRSAPPAIMKIPALSLLSVSLTSILVLRSTYLLTFNN